jgi:hypothetical protein
MCHIPEWNPRESNSKCRPIDCQVSFSERCEVSNKKYIEDNIEREYYEEYFGSLFYLSGS